MEYDFNFVICLRVYVISLNFVVPPCGPFKNYDLQLALSLNGDVCPVIRAHYMGMAFCLIGPSVSLGGDFVVSND